MNLGMGEILVILLVALLVFGPNRLPEMARSLGKAIRSFQAESQRAADVLRSSIDEKSTPTAPGVVDVPDVPPAAPPPLSPVDAPAPEAPVDAAAQAREATPDKPEPPPIDPALRRFEDT